MTILEMFVPTINVVAIIMVAAIALICVMQFGSKFLFKESLNYSMKRDEHAIKLACAYLGAVFGTMVKTFKDVNSVIDNGKTSDDIMIENFLKSLDK